MPREQRTSLNKTAVNEVPFYKFEFRKEDYYEIDLKL